MFIDRLLGTSSKEASPQTDVAYARFLESRFNTPLKIKNGLIVLDDANFYQALNAYGSHIPLYLIGDQVPKGLEHDVTHDPSDLYLAFEKRKEHLTYRINNTVLRNAIVSHLDRYYLRSNRTSCFFKGIDNTCEPIIMFEGHVYVEPSSYDVVNRYWREE